MVDMTKGFSRAQAAIESASKPTAGVLRAQAAIESSLRSASSSQRRCLMHFAAAKCTTTARTLSMRGQAAMEYLMTYGWALLVIAIVLAILVLINPFSPPPGCHFDQIGFNCNAPAFKNDAANTTLYLRVTNANNNNIYIYNTSTSIVCTFDKSPTPPPAPPASSPKFLLKRQEAYDVLGKPCSVPGGRLPAGSDFSGRVWIFYNNEEDGGTYPVRVVSASIAGKVS